MYRRRRNVATHRNDKRSHTLPLLWRDANEEEREWSPPPPHPPVRPHRLLATAWCLGWILCTGQKNQFLFDKGFVVETSFAIQTYFNVEVRRYLFVLEIDKLPSLSIKRLCVCGGGGARPDDRETSYTTEQQQIVLLCLSRTKSHTPLLCKLRMVGIRHTLTN